MSWKIREAVRHLEHGGIIAYPTETVYGLGCDPFNAAAVLHLLALKQRDTRQGLVLIAAEFAQLTPLLLPLGSATKSRVTRSTPVATTWVLPCLPTIPAWLRGRHTGLAVRVSSHPVAAALCKHWGGPLVSTSANLHGRHPATSPLAVRKAFNGQLDCILHGEQGSGLPSTIRDGISGKILRSG
ncbi:MAG: L-threonylcarbamoyladenylate synthase [Gammaproteobacteria bacterium]